MRFENLITKFQFSLTMNSDMNVFFVTCGSQTPSSNNRYIGTCGTWELELQIFLTKIDFAPSLESAVILNQILSRQYKYQNIKICLQISSGGIANKEYWSTLVANVSYSYIFAPDNVFDFVLLPWSWRWHSQLAIVGNPTVATLSKPGLRHKLSPPDHRL